MKETISNLSNSTAEEALRAVENGELTPFLQVCHSKYIKWSRSEGNILVGQIPFLRAGKSGLSLYKFRLQQVTNDRINIAILATSFVYILVPLIFIVGLLMFFVPVIIPIIVLLFTNNTLKKIQEDLRQALEAWDKTQTKRV